MQPGRNRVDDLAGRFRVDPGRNRVELSSGRNRVDPGRNRVDSPKHMQVDHVDNEEEQIS